MNEPRQTSEPLKHSFSALARLKVTRGFKGNE